MTLIAKVILEHMTTGETKKTPRTIGSKIARHHSIMEFRTITKNMIRNRITGKKKHIRMIT